MAFLRRSRNISINLTISISDTLTKSFLRLSTPAYFVAVRNDSTHVTFHYLHLGCCFLPPPAFLGFPNSWESSCSSLKKVSSQELQKLAADFDGESTVSNGPNGASGDLAKKKIFSPLSAFYYEGCLPKHPTIYGYARSKMTDGELRDMISKPLTFRIDKM